MTPEELEALAGRVEATTGQDRDLDAAVALATRWFPPMAEEKLRSPENTMRCFGGWLARKASSGLKIAVQRPRYRNDGWRQG